VKIASVAKVKAQLGSFRVVLVWLRATAKRWPCCSEWRMTMSSSGCFWPTPGNCAPSWTQRNGASMRDSS
jgi:hypothetical protein